MDPEVGQDDEEGVGAGNGDQQPTSGLDLPLKVKKRLMSRCLGPCEQPLCVQASRQGALPEDLTLWSLEHN